MRMMSFKKKLNKKLKKRQAKFNKRINAQANLKRTEAELWAEEFILKRFTKKQFIPEFKFKFRRFDFFFMKSRCALEVDGGYHSAENQKTYDINVDNFLLQNHNIKIFRVKNFDEPTLLKHLDDIALITNTVSIYDSKKVIKFNKLNDKTIGRKIKTRKSFEAKIQSKKFSPKIILKKSENNACNKNEDV